MRVLIGILKHEKSTYCTVYLAIFLASADTDYFLIYFICVFGFVGTFLLEDWEVFVALSD